MILFIGLSRPAYPIILHYLTISYPFPGRFHLGSKLYEIKYLWCKSIHRAISDWTLDSIKIGPPLLTVYFTVPSSSRQSIWSFQDIEAEEGSREGGRDDRGWSRSSYKQFAIVCGERWRSLSSSPPCNHLIRDKMKSSSNMRCDEKV